MNWTRLLGGVVAGAGLMFFLDPDRGARRRALVRDQALSARRRTRRALEATLEDARNRASGTITEVRQRLRAEPVSDAALVERVRARLGLVCPNADAVAIDAQDGVVALRGTVERGDIARIVRTARWTRGVRVVDDQLAARDDATEATGG
jgi:osmotically-inducible protein OsmY